MSSLRSDWREQLHVNSSGMEQELAIRLQEDGISFRNAALGTRNTTQNSLSRYPSSLNNKSTQPSGAAITNNQIWDATGIKPMLNTIFSKHSDSIDPELMKKWKEALKET